MSLRAAKIMFAQHCTTPHKDIIWFNKVCPTLHSNPYTDVIRLNKVCPTMHSSPTDIIWVNKVCPTLHSSYKDILFLEWLKKRLRHTAQLPMKLLYV